MMDIVIKKFGGTSAADIDKINAIAQIICDYQKQNPNVKLVIVISAMSGVTNHLISMYSQICNDKLFGAGDVSYGAMVSAGENISSALLSRSLNEKHGLESINLQGWQIPIKTNDNFIDADIKEIGTEYLTNLLQRGVMPVVAGFQGVNDNNQITTLGKGGSDTTAIYLAKYLKAKKCYIYTDVDGVYDADPNIIQDTSVVHELGSRQMLDLSLCGAKIMHIKAAKGAFDNNIDYMIKSSFDIHKKGTIINNKVIDNSQILLSVNKNVVILDRADNSDILDKALYVSDNFIVMDIFNNIYDNAKINLSILGIITNKNIIKEVCDILQKNNISIIEYFAIKSGYVIIIDDYNANKALVILHKKFCINEKNLVR